MSTREEFERQRAALRQVERHEGRLLAAASVSLGVAQLLFLRWGEAHLEHQQTIAIASAAILAYLALICGLLWRRDRRLRAARPKCPRCGAALAEMSQRVAVATGKCDTCGGQVID